MKLAPHASLVKLRTSRPYRGLAQDDTAGTALVVGCVLVHPSHRRRGVARTLLEAAIAHARAESVQALYAYPRVPHETADLVHDEEAWMGPASMFVRRGFVRVAGEVPYPVMRLTVR
jgi:GNAT superfamily N-acetyltransferase